MALYILGRGFDIGALGLSMVLFRQVSAAWRVSAVPGGTCGGFTM